jgi:hypothetical protein
MAILKYPTVVGRHVLRATTIAVFAAVSVGALASTAEAKPNTGCRNAVTYLNNVSRQIGFARAAGDTAGVMFWLTEYEPAKTYAGSVCGW